MPASGFTVLASRARGDATFAPMPFRGDAAFTRRPAGAVVE
jgi:hypothetical protein